MSAAGRAHFRVELEFSGGLMPSSGHGSVLLDEI